MRTYTFECYCGRKLSLTADSTEKARQEAMMQGWIPWVDYMDNWTIACSARCQQETIPNVGCIYPNRASMS